MNSMRLMFYGVITPIATSALLPATDRSDPSIKPSPFTSSGK